MSTPTSGRGRGLRRLALAGVLAALVVVALTAFQLGRASRGQYSEERGSDTATLTDLRSTSHGLAFCVRSAGAERCGLAVLDPQAGRPEPGDRVRVTRLALRGGCGAFEVSYLRRAR